MTDQKTKFERIVELRVIEGNKRIKAKHEARNNHMDAEGIDDRRR